MRTTLYLILLISLNACLGNYPTSTPTSSNVSKISKEEKVKEGVSNHVKIAFASMGSYKNFKFGELFMLKPKEILELDEMIEKKNQMPLQYELYGDSLEQVIEAQDVKIAFKKQEIQDNGIYPWYEINHIFAIQPVTGDSATVYEYDFEVYPNYTIKEAHQNMMLPLSKKEYSTFKIFMNQSPVYESSDYGWANEMNSSFYTTCYAALDNEKEYKGELLKTIIRMTDYIRSNNQFNEKDFTLKVVQEWEKVNLPEIVSVGKYEKLAPFISKVDEVDVITGYQLNHILKEDSVSKSGYSFLFDLNFVLTSVKEK